MLNSPPKSYNCEVLSNKKLNENEIFLTRFHCPEIAQNSSAGQFINIKVNQGLLPLLRRPFSICRVDRTKGWFDILWQVVGQGTALMAKYKTGDVVNIIGPLGHGFRLKTEIQTAILVGGGLGIAPLPFLCAELSEKQPDKIKVYVGVRTKIDLIMAELLESFNLDITKCTEDGSEGIKGYVTEPLIEHLRSLNNQSGSVMFSCGPEPFLQRMIEISDQFNFESQISIESVMGCGFGICVGCPVETRNYVEGERKYKLTCVDGPVFDTREVKLIG